MFYILQNFTLSIIDHKISNQIEFKLLILAYIKVKYLFFYLPKEFDY